jgi:hypothetical protein
MITKHGFEREVGKNHGIVGTDRFTSSGHLGICQLSGYCCAYHSRLRGSRQIANIDFWRSTRDAWQLIDSIALSDDDTLRTADSLFHPNLAEQTSDDRRKRWLGYMMLNVYQSQYFGPHRSVPDLEEIRRSTILQLTSLVTNDVFYHLTQSGVYSNEFEEACRKLRQEQGLPTD